MFQIKQRLGVADKSGDDSVCRVAVDLIVARRKYISAARRKSRSVAGYDVAIQAKSWTRIGENSGRVSRNHTIEDVHFRTERSESGRVIDRARISDRRFGVAAQINARRIVGKDRIADR